MRAEMPQGSVLAMFLILSGAARFLVEFIRINLESILDCRMRSC